MRVGSPARMPPRYEEDGGGLDLVPRGIRPRHRWGPSGIAPKAARERRGGPLGVGDSLAEGGVGGEARGELFRDGPERADQEEDHRGQGDQG